MPFGPATTYTLGNGQAIKRTYVANYRMTDVNSPKFNVHYDRDALGQAIALRDLPTSAAQETYAYDGLHRLSGVSSKSFNESYIYDKTGDRLSKASTKPWPDPQALTPARPAPIDWWTSREIRPVLTPMGP